MASKGRAMRTGVVVTIGEYSNELWLRREGPRPTRTGK